MAPSVFKHAGSAIVRIAESFNQHVPLEERKVDAMSMMGGPKKTLSQRLPVLQRIPFLSTRATPAVADNGPLGKPYPHVRQRELVAAACGVVLSQIPGHNPARHKMPALAAEWLARYEAGEDLNGWFGATRNQAPRQTGTASATSL